MQCEARYFLVEMIVNGETKKTSVTARTQVADRKTIRNYYGKSAQILSVREKNNQIDLRYYVKIKLKND